MAADTSPPQAAEPKEQASKVPGWLVVLGALGVAGGLGIILYWGHVGKPLWEGANDKVLWDYLELLVVPAGIAIGVALINWMQESRQRKAEERQKARDSVAEDKRKARERGAQAELVRHELELENDRQQEAAVQAYLDQLTHLLVAQRDQGLVRMRVDDEVRQVIQARSEPLLRSLTAARRWNLILFMSVMGLLMKDRSLVSLAGADLTSIDGRGAPLQGVDLQGANLSKADLSGAHLEAASLISADLSGADLSGAHLEGAYLWDADLKDADLRGAHLEGAYLNEQDLSNVDLRDTYRTATYISGAKLAGEITLDDGEILEEMNGDRSSTKVEGPSLPRWWRTLPKDFWSIDPGEEYSIKVWKTLLSFSVLGEEDWYSTLGLPYAILLSPQPGITADRSLCFVSGPSVCDPLNPKDPFALVEAPKDTTTWVTWFENHPYLRSTKQPLLGAHPASISSGTQLHVEVDTKAPVKDLFNDPAVGVSVPFVPTYLLIKGNRYRVIVLAGQDEGLVILTEGPPDKFDEFIDRADKEVLANLYWGREAHEHLEGG